jgi:hypothetical protein
MFPFRILPIFLFVTSAFAAAPSGENWFTLESANFRVHHTAPLENYARRVAVSLERALPQLEKKLLWKAPTPLDVVIADPSDSANGLAMNFPSTRMELFSTAFEADSSLAHYDHWVNELAVHELTHIIANDAALGGYRVLRSIFGSWVKPNGLQPLWMIEGLAVYMETSLSSGGRGRSPLTYALLSEAVKKQQLPAAFPLHRANDGDGWWPGGNTPYLLGYFLQAGAARKDPLAPGKLSENNSRKIPFQPNSNAEEVVGKDWFTIWDETAAQLTAQLKPNESAASVAICPLTKSGKFTGGQALSPDGWIYFSEEDYKFGNSLARVRLAATCGEAEIQRLAKKRFGGPAQVAVSADGKTVAFAQYESSAFERLFSDLYLYDTEGETTRQLTKNERARDPAYLGQRLFYLRQNADLSMSIVEWIENQPRVLFTGQPMERLSSLFAVEQGLYFSQHKNHGIEQIWKISLTGGSPEPITTPEKTTLQWDRNPYVDASGNLWFARSLATEKQAAQRQLIWKKTKLGLSAFAVPGYSYLDRPIPLAEQEVLLTLATENGLNLAKAKLVPLDGAVDTNSVDFHEALTGEKPQKVPVASDQDLAAVGTVVPYSQKSVATSLWPQYWLPEITAAEDGYLIGASTSGNDPLDYHRWSAVAQYDSRAKFPVYRAYYQNRTYPTSFFVEAKQSNNFFRSTKVSNRSTQYSASVTLPIHPASLTLGAAFQEKFLFGRKTQSGILYQNLGYQEVGKTPSALDPNSGILLSLYSGLYPNSKGEEFFADLRPKFGIFFAGFAPEHSIGIQTQGGFTTNRLLASNYYLGGGASYLNDSDYIVRGYPIDSLFGQRIITSNLSYSIPLAYPFRGWSTNPLFIKMMGLRVLADFGTANFTANYRNETFQFYQSTKLGRKILAGFGLDFVITGSAFYHVPISLVLGAHYGPQKFAGGDLMGYFGINAGVFGR